MNRLSRNRLFVCRSAIISLSGFVLLLAGTVGSAQARSLAEISLSKELRACFDISNPNKATVEPADCNENCKFSGLLYEQVTAFAQSLGIKVKARRVEWDEQFFNKEGKTVREERYTPELLASGRCDLYPNNLTKNEWRLKKMDFVVLFPNRLMVIVPKSRKSEFKTAANLAGKMAVVEKNTSYHQWLLDQNQTTYAANPVRIELIDSSKSKYAVIDAEAADFTLADSDSAILATRLALKRSVVAFPVGPVDEIGWAFRKEDKDLQAAVQGFFDQQRKSESSALNKIWLKHLGISLNKFVALVKSTE